MKFAVLGHPVKHSLSPKIFSILKKEFSLNFDYQILDILPEQLAQQKDLLLQYDGFNITAPYKEKILEFANELSGDAEQLKACNVFHRQGNGFKAFNTDVFGFQKSFEDFQLSLNSNILVLGNGGAARAVGLGLAQMGFQNVKFRTRSSWEPINFLPQAVIQASSLGMNGNWSEKDLTFFNFSDAALQRLEIAYDLIYHPKETIFLEKIKNRVDAVKTKNGLDMLIYQALKTFEIWFDEKLDFKKWKEKILGEVECVF
jgi:shikimate dehydrogenase